MWHMCYIILFKIEIKETLHLATSTVCQSFAYTFPFTPQINLKERHYGQLQFADEQWAERGYVTILYRLPTKVVRIPTPVSPAQLVLEFKLLKEFLVDKLKVIKIFLCYKKCYFLKAIILIFFLFPKSLHSDLFHLYQWEIANMLLLV